MNAAQKTFNLSIEKSERESLQNKILKAEKGH